MKYERLKCQESFDKCSWEDLFLPFVFVLMPRCEVAMPRVWSLEKSMAGSCYIGNCGDITSQGTTVLDSEM